MHRTQCEKDCLRSRNIECDVAPPSSLLQRSSEFSCAIDRARSSHLTQMSRPTVSYIWKLVRGAAVTAAITDAKPISIRNPDAQGFAVATVGVRSLSISAVNVWSGSAPGTMTASFTCLSSLRPMTPVGVPVTPIC